MRPVLYQLFPARLKRYVEVFGGSGALLFGREPQKGLAEVYNDYNSDLVNLFTCVRDRPLALMDELGYLPLNSREEFESLRRFLRQKEPDAPYLREELELCQKRFPPPEAEELTQVLLDRASLWDVKRAAAYYKVIRYSYGAGAVPLEDRRPISAGPSGRYGPVPGGWGTWSSKISATRPSSPGMTGQGPSFTWTRPTTRRSATMCPSVCWTICGCTALFVAVGTPLSLCPTTITRSSGNCTRAFGSLPPAGPTPCGIAAAAGGTRNLSSQTTTRRSGHGPRS